jgi:hypothetical protein
MSKMILKLSVTCFETYFYEDGKSDIILFDSHIQ